MPNLFPSRLVPSVFLGLSCLGLAETPANAEQVPGGPSLGSHAIALETDNCMEESGWLAEPMLDCAEAAEQSWHAEVERLTDRLSSVIGSEAREALEVSDDAWQASRDAELAFIDAYHQQLEEVELGDPHMRPLSVQMYRNEVLKDRVERLEGFLAGLERIPEVPEEETLDDITREP